MRDNLETSTEETYPDLFAKMQEMDVNSEELCDYMTWAYMNAIPLSGSIAD